jgi:TonB family protein
VEYHRALTETDFSGAPDPQRVGRYQVIEEIGDGAMGRVWRGFDPELSRTVAIKTVKSEYLTRDTREEYLHRFRREARAAGQLSHPNIVRIFDVGDDYFVMELVEGVTLADLLKHRQRLEVPEATALLAPLADAIDEAHRSGVIHRDIKPANIMVESDGRPKLMDFGVARLETSVATAAGQFFGSPSYMAPEQISQGELTARADLFSFAVVAYETLTGQRPFQGASITNVMYRVVHEPSPPPRELSPDLPPHFDHVFARALAKEPGLRFPTATAFLSALRGEDMDSLLAPLLADVPARAPGDDDRIASAETHDLPGAPTVKRPRAWLPWAALFVVSALAAAGWKVATRPTEMAQNASLQVEADPRGADVWLDGRRAAPAPVLFERLRRGTHRIRVSQDGYAPAELSFHVDDHMGVVPLRFSLTALTAPLEVRTEPGVTVSMDGQVLGTTPIPEVRVSPGLHQLLLEREGYLPQVHARQARAGEPLVLEAQLAPVPTEQAPAPSTRPPVTLAAAPPEPEPVNMGEVLTPPRRVSGDVARYPDEARRLQMEGSVLVDVVVEPNGSVGAVRVLESAGSILDHAVSEAVRTWRFEPARVEGQPVRVRWQFRQTFRPR